MGLDDFDAQADEPMAGSGDPQAEPRLDEDLFDFPPPDVPRAELPEEQELEDALDAVEELAASMAPELEAVAAPAEPGRVDPDDEDLFGFDEIDKPSRAVSPDLEENLDEIFGGLDEGELDAIGGDPAVDALLEAEDVVPAATPAGEPSAEFAAVDPVAPVAPAAPGVHDVVPAALEAQAPPTGAPVRREPVAAAAAPLDDRLGRAKHAVSLAAGRFKDAPIVWLIGLLVAVNLLMLVLFWNSLGDFRDAMVDTVHKVAAASPQSTVLRERARPRLEVRGPAEPVLPPNSANEEVLRAEDTLAASIDLIAKNEFEVARRDLYRLLARIDALPLEQRDWIEAEANHQIGETFRGQADALAAAPDDPLQPEAVQ